MVELCFHAGSVFTSSFGFSGHFKLLLWLFLILKVSLSVKKCLKIPIGYSDAVCVNRRIDNTVGKRKQRRKDINVPQSTKQKAELIHPIMTQ